MDIKASSTFNENDDESKSIITDIIDTLKVNHSMEDTDIAMAAIKLAIGTKPFLVNDDETWIHRQNNNERDKFNRNNNNNRSRNSSKRSNNQSHLFETFKFNIGKVDSIRVPNIISSICSATNINGRSIGKIQIFNDYSLVDLPRNLNRETKNKLKTLKIRIY